MKKGCLFACILFFICMFYQTATSEISLRVFSKDEGLTEVNIVKPRICIQNLGTEAIADFYCYYYFTTEQNKTPILDDYYTPDAITTLEKISNGNYKVKITFTGVTLNPGQTLPSSDGKVIGLHYSDWSVWDKTNDMSNTGLATFTLNGNIPVYSSTGTLLYGNTLPDPENPPQPPRAITASSDYAVLSKENTYIRDRVVIKGGNVGSNEYTEIGANSVVNGSVFSGGSMFLRSNDTIKGNAAACEAVNRQNGSVVTGTIRSNAQLEIPQITVTPVIAGTRDTSVNDHGTIDLQPGLYRDFHAFSNSTITMHSGDYTFNTFYLETDVKIILKVGNTDRLNLNVSTNLRFGDRTTMSFEQGTAYPYSIKIYSSQTGQVNIGTDCQIYGNIICPEAEVYMFSRSNLNGAVYGKKVVIEPDVVVCKPPLLQDLWHSEWAYAPSFLPFIFDYTAIVPDATTTLNISIIAQDGTIVTVNGKSLEEPVNLTGSDMTFPILLSNTDQCGTTSYNLHVTKASNYQIFVNDNSPCEAGREDGNSWETAYKDLQQGLNRALVDGKEVWVAEGTYKPTQCIDSTDPRSATFMIQPGAEIKGGFDGTETIDEPKGSPYKTIITGDISSNDSVNGTWPPAENDTTYNDNVYHVITITGNNLLSPVHLSRFIVEHGIANGTGTNADGGGIYIRNCSPVLELIGIRKNLAIANGAGIYVKSSIKSIENCLFKDNCSLSGLGGGIYLNENCETAIDASVFDGNITKDTSAQKGGSALYLKKSKLDIVNTVFTRDSTGSINGTIFNDSGAIKITNCTFAYNFAAQGATGIRNTAGATTTIINTILWNSNNKDELAGSGFTVSYSCITKGYTGTGNISANPQFTNPNLPEGENGHFGALNDGLQLQGSSLCINSGKNEGAPDVDFLTRERPFGGTVDMGSYEFINNINCNQVIFGIIKEGVFTQNDDLTRVEIIHQNEIYQYSRSNCQRVARAYVEKNKHTKDANTLTAYVQPLYFDGTPAAKKMEVKLTKIGEENGFLVFQSRAIDYSWGKKFIFTSDPMWHEFDNPWAYIVYVPSNPKLLCTVPYSQFRR